MSYLPWLLLAACVLAFLSLVKKIFMNLALWPFAEELGRKERESAEKRAEGERRRIRHWRFYPGPNRELKADGAIYQPGVHALDWKSEEQIIGWKPGRPARHWLKWDGHPDLPLDFGYPDYETYRACMDGTMHVVVDQDGRFVRKNGKIQFADGPAEE